MTLCAFWPPGRDVMELLPSAAAAACAPADSRQMIDWLSKRHELTPPG
jgi:hypothetical protein